MNWIKELQDFSSYLNGKVSEGTVKVYTDALGRWFRYLDGTGVSKASAQSYIDSIARSRSASTANLRARAIERYFRWKGMEVHLEAPTVQAPKPEYLSVEQINILLAKSTTLLERVLVTVLFDSGVRISELLNLAIRDIDWSGGFISVTRKGGRKEEVNISPKALDILRSWLDQRQFESERVFDGLTYYEAWSVLKRLGRRAGVSVHPHIFRHSRAIQMRMSGARLEDIRDHLGHKNIATTANIYSAFKAVDLKKRIPSW
jgi:integrase/recombinase XerD